MISQTEFTQINRDILQSFFPNLIYEIENDYTKVDHLEYSSLGKLSIILQDERTLKKALRKYYYAKEPVRSEMEELRSLLQSGFLFGSVNPPQLVLPRKLIKSEMPSLFIWAEEQLHGFRSLKFVSESQVEVTGPDGCKVPFPRKDLEDFLGTHEKLELANMFRESDLYDPTWSEDLEAYEDKARENLINLAEKLFDEIPNFRSIARGEDWEHVTIKTKNVNYLFEVPDMRFHEFDPEDLSAYKVYMPQNRMPRVPTYPIFKNLKKNEIAVWKLLFGRVPELRKSGNMYGPYPVVGEDMILVDRFFDLKIKTNFWGENSICDLDSKDSFVNMDLLKIIKDLSSLEGSVNLSSERPLYEGGNFQIKYNDSKHPAKLYEVEVPDYQDSPNEWRQAISREIPEILETARDDYKDMYRIDEEVRGSHLAQAIMRLVPSSCPVPQDILVSALKGDEFEFPGYLGSMTKAAREYIGRFSNFSVEELITEIDQLARYGYLIKIPDEEQNCWYARSRSSELLGN